MKVAELWVPTCISLETINGYTSGTETEMLTKLQYFYSNQSLAA